MKTLITTDVALMLYDGRYYYEAQVSTIIKRYHNYFGKVSICARVTKTDEFPLLYEDVTDLIDTVTAIPSLEKTLLGFYDKQIQQAVRDSEFLICRCPGVISYRAAAIARKQGKKYFTESMGCAWDAYWNHGVLGKIAAPYVFLKMKQTVYHADFALYVTNEFLQKRYPCKNRSIGVSNVLISSVDEAALQNRLLKIANADYQELTLMTTAAVDVRYKGQEYVVKAIPVVNKAGIRVHYLLVGAGDPTYLKEIARMYGVEDQVEFVGRRPLAEVFELLDSADIYIQPSLQEGLPRSVIEAMSRGCPVIGARTAGIPELISPECVVERKSVKGLADTIVGIATAEKMTELAKKNFEKSKDYRNSILGERREQYFSHIISEVKRK